MSRIPQIRRLLTEQLIEELLVRCVLNIGETEQKENRIAYHFRLAYFCFLHQYHLHQHVDTRLYVEQELFFMKRLNEYLPDFLRFEANYLREMQDLCSKIPCYGAVISRDNEKEYLLVQDRRTNKYGFCKGKISEGESIQECVKRQVMQETGLQIKNFGKRVSNQQINGKQYIFIEAKLEENHHAHEEIVYEGHNHHRQIKKLVWWSVAKIKQICSSDYKGDNKVNLPTLRTFRKIL